MREQGQGWHEADRWRDADPFTAVGLSALDASIMSAVVEEQEVTAATLCARTGSSAASISVAVRRLMRLGLLDRVLTRRPSVVFLAAGAVVAMERLVQEAEDRLRLQHAHRDEAIALLTAAAARRVERGRPMYEAESVVGRGTEHGLGRRGRTRHDQVLSLNDASFGTAPHSLLRCPARLLITDCDIGQDTDHEVALERIAGRQNPGSEVRATSRTLPKLWLLDGDRVGVQVGARDGQMRAWSRDMAHVRAAAQLFELWWEEVGTGLCTPHPPPPQEPAWDEIDDDEWDPAELPDPEDDGRLGWMPSGGPRPG